MVFITSPTEISPMVQPTNCVVPTGGVFRPSAQLISMTMPNCSVLAPYCWQIGRKIGVQIRMVAAMSRKVPSTNRMMFTHRKITQGELVVAASAGGELGHAVQADLVAEHRADADQQQHGAGGDRLGSGLEELFGSALR